MSEQPFGDRHGPTPDEMRRAFDARTAVPPRPEPSRYDRLGPLARALVDDYDALDLAEMLVKAQDELAALRQVARGYCPHYGRGDAALTVDDWEQQRQRADQAEGRLAHLQESSEAVGRYLTRTVDERNQLRAALDRARETAAWIRRNYPALTHANDRLAAALEQPAAGPTATEATEAATTTRVFAALHRSAEQDVSRVIALYERWCAAGPPPLGTLMSRWWDARLVELLAALDEPAAGPAATQATDERCSLDASETEPNTWTEPAHDRPCTATIEGRATPGGRQVQCTREAGHPENHVGPKQGSNGRVLWTDSNAGAVPHRRG